MSEISYRSNKRLRTFILCQLETSGATGFPRVEIDRVVCCNCIPRKWRTADHTPRGATDRAMVPEPLEGGIMASAEGRPVMRSRQDSKEMQRQ